MQSESIPRGHDRCAIPGCLHHFRDDKWGRIRAYAAGWFMHMDGKVNYCPDHLPEWVIIWRARRNAR